MCHLYPMLADRQKVATWACLAVWALGMTFTTPIAADTGITPTPAIVLLPAVSQAANGTNQVPLDDGLKAIDPNDLPGKPTFFLSEDERHYLASLPPLRAELLAKWEPFSYQDREGKPAGILRAYLDYLSVALGLRFDMRSMNEPSESARQRQVGNIDLNQYVLPERLAQSYDQTRTRPVESYPLIMVGRAGSPAIGDISGLAHHRIALVAQSLIDDFLHATVPSATIVRAASPEAALELVRDGKADVFIGNLASADRSIHNNYAGQLRVVGATGELQLIGFDVRPGLEPLVPLIDRAIEAMPLEQRQAIRSRHLTTNYEFGLSPGQILWRAIPYLVLIFMIMAMLAFGYWRQKREVAIRMGAERKLQQAQQLAEKASAAKSSFLTVMSHEMRTPLYGILGTLELLSLTRLDDHQRQHVMTIQSSSGTLLSIIDDLLDHTKAETGQLQLESVLFDPVALIEDTTRAHSSLALRKGLALTCYVQADLPWLIGDPGRLRQALGNLLTNALKFTAKGHVAVRAFCASPNENDPKVVRLALEVIDTGVGIATDKQAQLFEPFVQGDAATARRYGGSGLGLSICRQLARLMGGDITLESELGQGSRFRMSLSMGLGPSRHTDEPELPPVTVLAEDPEWKSDVIAMVRQAGGRAIAYQGKTTQPGMVLLIADDDRNASPDGYVGIVRLEADGPMEAQERPRGLVINAYHQSGWRRALCLAANMPLHPTQSCPCVSTQTPQLELRVLAVDDHPFNRQLIQRQLEQLGCQAMLVDSGEDALKACKQNEFDVVLSDVHMPGMDGYTLTRTLRATGYSLPIIGITASVAPGEAERCLASGMNGYLSKPVLLHDLADSLTQVLPEQSASLAARGAKPPIKQRHDERTMRDDRTLLIHTIREDAQVLKQCIEQGHLRSMAEHAHRIRGAVTYLGGWEELVDLCEELEAAAHEALESVQQLANDFEGYLSEYLETE